ncbi:MAG: acyl-CoA dehydrogenase family protein, partial [Deltaproteobacteria bacterium]|nr:acyl-CoA dehydrogenase family protein [Deltaproteobacteria bacterium]
MDFKLNQEERILRDSLRDFLKKEIAPLAEEYEFEQKYFTKKIFKKLDTFGFAAALVPEDNGGLGLGFTSYAIMVEQLAKAWGALRSMVTSSGLATRLISRIGTKEQRDKFLPRLLSMDEIACFALTEPNAGSDASAIETEAVRDGDYYILNGTKTLITGGSIADVLCVYATVDPAKKGKGITAFLVKKGESEFQTSDIRKMGNRSCPLSEIVLKDCRVPVENRLGEEGEGLKIALGGLNVGRVTVTFGVIGVAQAALEAAIGYAKTRHQFGKPIGSFQLVQELIVDMALKVDTARILGYRVATLLDDDAECRREASFAKLYATEAAVDVTSNAIQVFGGYGYTEEYPVERYYRDV